MVTFTALMFPAAALWFILEQKEEVLGTGEGKTLCQFNTEPALSVGLFTVRFLLSSFECTQLIEQLMGTTLNLDFKHSVYVKRESDTEIPHFIILTRQLCAALVQLQTTTAS